MQARIVHISDIHLSLNNSVPFKQYFLDAVLKDLKHLNGEKKIDIVCLTGDLLDKGGSSFKESGNKYHYFIKEFWGPIASLLQLDDSRLFIVPGNHDVDENLIEEVNENGLVSTLKSVEKVNDFVIKNSQKENPALERQKEFKDFEREFYKENITGYISNFESCHVVNVGGARIGIACLNTSWRCYTQQVPDALVMGTTQIANASSFLKDKNCDFIIGMMHHPIDFISSIEKEEATIRLRTSEFDIVLFGHTHSGETIYQTGSNGNLFISTARTGFSNPREAFGKYQSGYTIIDINDLDVNCKFRSYVNGRNAFDVDTAMGQGGEYHTKLFPRDGRSEYYRLINLATELGKSKIENINESLVTSGTNTVAPRSVNEIFVLPRLTDAPASYDNFEKQELINLKELLSFNENILLFGDKESGKSTLLSKLFIELSENIPFYQRIAIKLDANDIKGRVIRTLVKEFIGNITNSDLDSFLNQGKITILVDNILSGEEGSVVSFKMQEFINKWPRVKFIAATSVHSSIFMEDDANCLAGFKNIYIGSVGIKEFKSLAGKWFCDQSQDWIKNNLENLIKVFEKLKISRTFFSVSLFLWIVEQNINYKPTNNYDLLSMFMKYILEGFNFLDTRAGSYSFNKKIELLTELSLEMYSNGDKSNGYALKESEAIAVFQKNFTSNQLRLHASEKVNEFIKKGILRYDIKGGAINFRFESFFQYFLARNIGSDTNFTQEVIGDNSFLLFIEEIDFYTGYRRNSKEMLERAVEELNKQFLSLDETYQEKNMDSYFPKTPYILNKMDTNKFLNRTQKLKLNNSEIEEVMGKQMDMLPVNDSVKVKKNLPERDVFSSALEMAARVLKNTENIKDPQYINLVIDLIISKSAKMSVFIQSLFVDFIKNNPEPENMPFPAEALLYFGPIVSQSMLFKWIGTEFIELPLLNKIDKYISDGPGAASELELFTTAFIYADMKANNYPAIIEKAVSAMNNKFMLEVAFFKVFGYYAMKSDKSALLPIFEKIMVIIIAKVKGMPRKIAAEFVENTLKKYRKDIPSGGLLLD